MSKKRYAAFLSFAEPDRDLVSTLHNWLKDKFQLDTFFAPDTLPRGSEDWIREIQDGIKNSHCFVLILTRYSVKRPWVLYELGAASMAGLPIRIARTANISTKELQKLPGHPVFAFNLYSEKGLGDLVLKIYEYAYSTEQMYSNERLIRDQVGLSTRGRHIINRSKRRTIFIAGSVPSDSKKDIIINSLPNLSEEEVFRRITRDITKALLDAEFFVSSCPDVSVVGISVIEEVLEWTKDNSVNWKDVYSMSGQYEVGELPGRIPKNKNDLTDLLRNMAKESRKDYLLSKEWLIIIGGKNRTKIEYEAASEIKTINICSLPIFGGVGLEVWNLQQPDVRINLNPEETEWNSKILKTIVDHINKS